MSFLTPDQRRNITRACEPIEWFSSGIIVLPTHSSTGMASKRPGRPRVTGYGRKPPSNNRECLSSRDKLAIVVFLEQHGMPATLDKHYRTLNNKARDSKRRTIYQWRAAREDLEARCADPKLADLKYVRKVGVATLLSAQAEQELVAWVNLLRKDGVPVSGQMLRLKALNVADEFGISGLRASWHWQRGFMRRHRLSLRARTRQGQVTLEHAQDVAVAFGMTVQQKMLELGIRKVYNADQTGEWFAHY